MTNANSSNAVRETAADLLKEIAKEREALIKAGKIKKTKPLPEITDDEIPYEIPENWEWVRLGDIGIWGSGATPLKSNSNYYTNGTIPWLLTGDLNDGLIQDIPNKITELALEETSVKLNQTGSVLLAMYGATIGKAGILSYPATTNQACCACQPYSGIYNWYLLYYLLSQRNEFQGRGVGGAQPNISKEKIVVTLFPLPPLSEQKKIVALLDDVLSRIDKARENIEKNIENTEALYQSKVESIFSESDAESISKKLKDICIIRPPKRDIIGKLSPDTMVSFAPMEDLGINQKYLQPTKEKHLSEVSGSYTYFSDNDVLLAKVTPCFENGKVGIARDLVNSVGFGSSEYIVYRPKEGLLSEYLYYFLNRASVRKIGEGSMDGSVGLKRIQKIFYEDIEIPLPPLSEQKKIVAELDALEKQRSTLTELYTKKLQALDELRNSVLEKAFRGELT